MHWLFSPFALPLVSRPFSPSFSTPSSLPLHSFLSLSPFLSFLPSFLSSFPPSCLPSFLPPSLLHFLPPFLLHSFPSRLPPFFPSPLPPSCLPLSLSLCTLVFASAGACASAGWQEPDASACGDAGDTPFHFTVLDKLLDGITTSQQLELSGVTGLVDTAVDILSDTTSAFQNSTLSALSASSSTGGVQELVAGGQTQLSGLVSLTLDVVFAALDSIKSGVAGTGNTSIAVGAVSKLLDAVHDTLLALDDSVVEELVGAGGVLDLSAVTGAVDELVWEVDGTLGDVVSLVSSPHDRGNVLLSLGHSVVDVVLSASTSASPALWDFKMDMTSRFDFFKGVVSLDQALTLVTTSSGASNYLANTIRLPVLNSAMQIG